MMRCIDTKSSLIQVYLALKFVAFEALVELTGIRHPFNLLHIFIIVFHNGTLSSIFILLMIKGVNVSTFFFTQMAELSIVN